MEFDVRILAKEKSDLALRNGEARFRSYFQLPIAGLAITSPDKRWLEVNDGLCAMLGYSAQEFAEKTWAELTHPDDLARDEAQFARVLAGEIDAYVLEKRYIHQRGNSVWVELSVGCVRRPDGAVDYLVALAHDITAHKQIEATLRQSEARYRLLAENMVDVVWTMNLAGQFTYVSPSVLQLRGYTPEEVMQQSPEEAVCSGSMAALQAGIAQAFHTIHTGERLSPVYFQIEQPCKDGSTVWTEATGRVMYDELQRPVGIVGVSRDITARRQTEEALRISEARHRLIAENTRDVIWVMGSTAA
jgi:PAS domain S-box-containing protein